MPITDNANATNAYQSYDQLSLLDLVEPRTNFLNAESKKGADPGSKGIRDSKAATAGAKEPSTLPRLELTTDENPRRVKSAEHGNKPDDWIAKVEVSGDGKTTSVTFKDGSVSKYQENHLVERINASGTRDVYLWKDGSLVGMQRGDGKTLKFQDGNYVLFDAGGRSLGKSPFTVRTGLKEGYEVQGRPVSSAELAPPFPRSGGTADGGAEGGDDVITVSTSEPGKAMSFALLKALSEENSDKATSLLNEMQKNGSDMNSIASAYQTYTGRSLNDDMKRIGKNAPDASYESVMESKGRLQNVFERVDSDKNGSLSDAELSAAVNDPSYRGDDAQVVAGLRKAYIYDSGLVTRPSLTIDDLQNYQKALAAQELLANFDSVDSNKNGRLDASEIIDFAANHKDIDGGRADLMALRDSWAKTGKLSRNDIEVMLFGGANAINDAVSQVGRNGNVERSLYGDLKPEEAIRSENFGQGATGDCHIMSTLTSMASTPEGRKTIQNMIRDNQDGTYTVTFPGASDEPITVSKPTEAQQMIYAGGRVSGAGYWPAVIETAYGEYVSRSIARRNVTEIIAGDVKQENAGLGASPYWGASSTVNFFTGQKTESRVLVASTEGQLDQILTQSRKAGTPIIMGRAPLLGETDAPTRHFYAIVDYDPVRRVATVMNPWNESKQKYGAKFEMPLSQLRTEFVTMAYVPGEQK